MAISFPSLPAWLWQQPKPASSCDTSSAAPQSANSIPCPGPTAQRPAFHVPMRRPSRNRRRASKYRRARQRVDLEFDIVLVSSDGGYCFSASDSEDSDWSVGWFEPHAPDFCSDADPENSFAVLVPCYGSPPAETVRVRGAVQEEASKSQLWAGVLSSIAKDPQAEVNRYIEQWLSSLQNYSI